MIWLTILINPDYEKQLSLGFWAQVWTFNCQQGEWRITIWICIASKYSAFVTTCFKKKKKKRQTLGIAGEINDDIKKFIFLYQSL